MVLKNAAVRFGRRALAPSVSRTTLRQLSTAPTTTDASAPAAAPAAPEIHLKVALNANKKKQKALNETIVSLGTDSAHEHRGAAWTSTHGLGPEGKELSVAQQYAEFQRIQKKTRALGSRLERRYVPNEMIRNPPRPEDVSLELLMASQTHMGHNTSLWNPSNSRYIYGIRDGIHVISLETTAAHLRRAARVVEEVSYRGGLVLFVGTRKGQMEIVTRAAELAGACHLFTKWTPGGITNRDVILRAQGVKVVNQLDMDLDDFGEFKKSSRPLMPDLVVCLNPLENYTLLYECGLKDIPTIGVIDTNADPTWVTYTIPANDDSLRSVGVIAGVLGRAGEAGQRRRIEDAKKGNVSWSTHPDLTRHMKKEIRAVVRKRKEVMGRMQSNVTDFTEEEQKLLQSKFGDVGVEVSEDDMMAFLGQAAAGEEQATKMSVSDIEAQLKTVVEATAEIQAALNPEQSVSDIKATAETQAVPNPEQSVSHIETQLRTVAEATAEIQAALNPKQSAKTPSLEEVEAQLASAQAAAVELESAIKGGKTEQ